MGLIRSQSKARIFAALLFGVSPLVCGGAAGASDSASSEPIAANEIDIEARVAALVGELTLDEKIQLLHGYFPPLAKAGSPDGMIPSAGHVPGIPRLGIPTLRETDASLGVANQIEQRKGDVATALPAGLATAATFSPDLAFKGGAMIGSEAKAKRFNVMLAGGVNLTRDPWAGRNFEYLGEDPLLAGILAGEAIRGVQSSGIVSTVKHFALNAQETGRTILDARIGEAALRESDLLAFQIAIERGRPWAVMCGYNKINGDYACENRFLLDKVLKQDWGYPGWVMSDWGGVHSTVKSALAGLDQQSGQELDRRAYFSEDLKHAILDGQVPLSRIDDMVGRILRGLIASGAMDSPAPETPEPIAYAANAEVAQQVAEAGIVLLRNEGALLPLSARTRHILLVGGHADVGVLSGGGSSQVRSVGGAPVEIALTSGPAMSFARRTWHASSPLEAIRKAAPRATISYLGSDDPSLVDAARRADVVVIFATQWQTEAEDVEALALPEGQDATITAVAAANPNTVVVLETGGPVLMPWLGEVKAVLEAWYPGQRGGTAIANVLFGKVNPSGRLPITFPSAASQAPRPEAPGLAAIKAADENAAAASANAAVDAGTASLQSFAVDYVEGSNVGYRWYEGRGHRPLFPFGYGLSYTRFNYANLRVVAGSSLTVSFDVSNFGNRAGTAVPQLYVSQPGGTKPARLAGWERVTLKPGERQRVTIKAEPRILADYDVALQSWRIAPGEYRLALSSDAATPILNATASLEEMKFRP